MLQESFGGLAANVVKQSNHSVDKFVQLMTANFPGFRDEAVYQGCQVRDPEAEKLIALAYRRHRNVQKGLVSVISVTPSFCTPLSTSFHLPITCAEQVFFYKRAQILAGDIWGAYGRQTSPHPFGFDDVASLTMFADYRVPQILRARGVLEYSEALARAVDARKELPPGSEEEVSPSSSASIMMSFSVIIYQPSSPYSECSHETAQFESKHASEAKYTCTLLSLGSGGDPCCHGAGSGAAEGGAAGDTQCATRPLPHAGLAPVAGGREAQGRAPATPPHADRVLLAQASVHVIVSKRQKSKTGEAIARIVYIEDGSIVRNGLGVIWIHSISSRKRWAAQKRYRGTFLLTVPPTPQRLRT